MQAARQNLPVCDFRPPQAEASPLVAMRPKKPATADALHAPRTTAGEDVSVVFGTLVGVAALGLLIQGLLAYTLLPAGRGAYAVCIVFGTLLGLLFTPGTPQGTQYFVMAKRISVSQGVSAALLIGLVGGSLATVLAIPLIYSDIAFFQQAETHTFLLALVLVPLTSLSLSLDHQLIAHRRFKRWAVFSMLRTVTNVLAILILVWRQGLGVDGAILAFAISHGVMIASCFLDLRRHCGLVFEMPGRLNFIRILGYGLKYHVARIGNAVEPQIGVVVLGVISDQVEIGLFSAAITLMLGFMLISNSVGNVLLPRIASLERSALVALCLRLVCAVTAVALLALLALSKPLVHLLLSEAFLPVIPLLWMLAPGIFAYASSGLFMTHFKGVNRPDVCSWATFLGAGVNLGALLLLYPKLGVQAAAWAMTLGMVSRCAFLSIVFRRVTRMTWPAIWLPRPSDASFLWAAGQAMLARGVKG